MEKLKPYFAIPYFSFSGALIASGVASYIAHDFSLSMLSLLLSGLGPILMLAYFYANNARTSAKLPWLLNNAVLAAALGIVAWQQEAAAGTAALGVFAAFLSFAYVYWYSPLQRGETPELAVGQTLPDFELRTAEGKSVNSAEFRQSPSLLMFFRGNWCPLCMAQIGEIAKLYRQLGEMGVKIAMISPQSEKQTAQLADKFQVPFEFLIDHDNQVAKQLNILHEGAVPAGMPGGYDSDAPFPTVVLTDAQGKIIFADLTDNYRVRPEPESFLQVFAEHGIQPA